MYSPEVMDHFMNPRNVGEMDDASGVGTVGNAKCGDIMRMFLKVEDGVIVDVKFKTFGCGAAIATSSMATELVKGKTLDEALAVTNKAVADALGGLPPVKVHCSLLAEEAIKAAIEDYMAKNPKADGSGDSGKKKNKITIDSGSDTSDDAIPIPLGRVMDDNAVLV